MSKAVDSPLFTFEIYVLMTMKRRLSMTSDPGEETRLESTLSAHGLTLDEGQRIHARMLDILVDENSFFTNLKTFLGADKATKTIDFASKLWPEFDFTVNADAQGHLESARYHRASSAQNIWDYPLEIPKWGTDLSEFSNSFDPLRKEASWSIFDDFLPAYEEHRFEWNGRDYGAGFCWGIFIFASQIWA